MIYLIGVIFFSAFLGVALTYWFNDISFKSFGWVLLFGALTVFCAVQIITSFNRLEACVIRENTRNEAQQ